MGVIKIGLELLMNDEELLRYSRHILLPQLDIKGQNLICHSHVLIIGLGGLGSPVALYLAASGVGTLTLVDNDVLELSNLQRQIIHLEKDIGKRKTDSAFDRIRAINHQCKVNIKSQRLSEIELMEIVTRVDVVVDCSDNFTTRCLLNKVTQSLKVPLVSGAAIRMEGQVTVYDARNKGSACYQCIYHDVAGVEYSCSETGVLSPLLGVIGSLQAVEALKLLAKIGDSLSGRMIMFDALSMSWHEILLRKDPKCLVCN